MMKHLIAAGLATGICFTEAAAESLLQRSDWRDRKFETYLPRVNTTVPWLEIDTKTRLPKGDLPLGRGVASYGPLILPLAQPDVQVSINTTLSSGSM